MNRTGKIARLPHGLRNQVNHRLDQNHPGPQIVKWINSLPETKKIMASLFNGNPITEQNLSEWRNGGYLEWQTRRDFLADTRESVHDAAELEKISSFMADHAARMLSARILNTLRQWNGDPEDPAFASLKHLSTLLRGIATLRRGDEQAARLRMDQEAFDLARHARETPDPSGTPKPPVRSPIVQKWSSRFRTPVPTPPENPAEAILSTTLRALMFGHPKSAHPDQNPRSKQPPPPSKSDLIAPNQTTSEPPPPSSEPATLPTHTPTLTHTPSEPAPLTESPSEPAPFEPANSSIIHSPLSPPPEPAHSPLSTPPSPADSTIHASSIHDSPFPASPFSGTPMTAEEFNRLRHHDPDPMPEWRKEILRKRPIGPDPGIPDDPPHFKIRKSIMPYRCST